MEASIAKVRVKLGCGRVVEVVPLRRAWQRRFFLAREAEDKPVLMIHDSQVLSPDFEWEKLASEISGLNAGSQGSQSRHLTPALSPLEAEREEQGQMPKT